MDDADAAQNMELEAAQCVITVFQLRPTEDIRKVKIGKIEGDDGGLQALFDFFLIQVSG